MSIDFVNTDNGEAVAPRLSLTYAAKLGAEFDVVSGGVDRCVDIRYSTS